MSVVLLSRVFWTQFSDLSVTKGQRVITSGKSTAKLVMLSIADSADDFGENSYQSFETIAEKASIDRRSVMRVIQALTASGYLKVSGVSQYGTNNYSIALEKLGNAPKRRSKNGRPAKETGDSVSETGDSVSETGDSVSETGGTESPDPSFNRHLTNTKKRSVSEETRKSLASSLFGALAGDTAYTPDPEQIALENIRKSWDRIMRANSPWERWDNFDKWLLSQERAGYPVEKFCRWFIEEKFRRESVGMWTPKGNKLGQWSFKTVYPQAFPVIEETPAPAALAVEEPETHAVSYSEWLKSKAAVQA